jgi:hypothetical protein
MRDSPPGAASLPASGTHASGKSAARGGTAPNTSLAIRELTYPPAQPLNRSTKSAKTITPTIQPRYMCMHAGNPVFPTFTVLFFALDDFIVRKPPGRPFAVEAAHPYFPEALYSCILSVIQFAA